MTSCLILAAGMGSRLRPLTDDRPKGLVPLLGKPLLTYQIETLNSYDVTRLGIVTGYRRDKIEALGLECFHNDLYDSTNMVESLFAARAFLEETEGDLLITYGDIVYQRDNLKAVLEAEGDLVVMTDKGWLDLWSARNEDPLNDAETLRLTDDGMITELGKKPKTVEEIMGQYSGLIKVSAAKIADLIAFYDHLDRNASYDGRSFEQMYMTSFIQLMIDAGWKVKAAEVNHGWLEVDTVDDLKKYEELEAAGELEALWKHDV